MRGKVTGVVPAALSASLLLIIVGMEFAAISSRKKQQSAGKAHPQSWDHAPNAPSQPQDPFEAADERN